MKRPSTAEAGLVLSLEQFLTSIPSHAVNAKDVKNSLEKHSLAAKQILSLPPTGLTFFTNLRNLDLSDNLIRDLSPLSHMPALRHLNIAKNKISDLSPLITLQKTLMILDVSAQKGKPLKSLRSMFVNNNNNNDDKKNKQNEGKSIIVYTNLKTIIATDNDLETLGFYGSSMEALQSINRRKDFEAEILEEQQQKQQQHQQKVQGSSAVVGKPKNTSLPVLDTLVLSRNPTLGFQNIQLVVSSSTTKSIRVADDEQQQQETDLWGSLHLVSATLRKLSLSDCGLQNPLPQHLSLPLVNELRLAKNHISAFPQSIRFKSLQILDISHNQFESLDSVARFPFLKHLSVAGNPAMMNTTKTGDTIFSAKTDAAAAAAAAEKPASKTATVQTKMNDFLAFLYLFFSDLHTIDGKKFDREIVKAELDKNLVRQVKLRVVRAQQQQEEEEGDHDDEAEKPTKSKKDQQDKQKQDVPLLLSKDDDEEGSDADFGDDEEGEDFFDDDDDEENDDELDEIGHNDDNDDDDDDDDDDGKNDRSLLMRRRRRREDDDDASDQEQEKGGMMDKKRSNNKIGKKQIVVQGQIDSDDEVAIDADAFLSGAGNNNTNAGRNNNNLSSMAAKSIQSIKKRGPMTTNNNNPKNSSSNNNNNNAKNNKNNNKNNNSAGASTAAVTDSATIISTLQRAAANAKNISQW